MHGSTERHTRLESGLRVITEAIPTVRSASVGVWITRGSRDEPEQLNGVTHFLEHMLFKGTETRGVRDIAVAIDAMGGQLDAFTSRESACYYAMVLDQHLADAVELLADLLLHPRFEPQELERERGVVLEEIASAEDDPEDLLFETFVSRLWSGHPLGRPILGTPATVESFSPELLRQRMSVVGGGDVIVAAAGNLEHERFVDLVAGAFAELGPTAPWPQRAAPEDRPRCALVGRGDLEQVQLYLASSAPASGSEARYAAEVLNTMLGGSVSSRLFQVVREERGLAYSVYSSVSGYSDAGHLWIAAGTRASAAQEVLQLIAAELADLRPRPVAAEELGRIKEHLAGC